MLTRGNNLESWYGISSPYHDGQLEPPSLPYGSGYFRGGSGPSKAPLPHGELIPYQLSMWEGFPSPNFGEIHPAGNWILHFGEMLQHQVSKSRSLPKSMAEFWRVIWKYLAKEFYDGQLLESYLEISRQRILWCATFGDLSGNISPHFSMMANFWRVIWKYLSIFANIWRLIWKYLATFFYDGQLLESYLEISRQRILWWPTFGELFGNSSPKFSMIPKVRRLISPKIPLMTCRFCLW